MSKEADQLLNDVWESIELYAETTADGSIDNPETRDHLKSAITYALQLLKDNAIEEATKKYEDYFTKIDTNKPPNPGPGQE